MGGVTIPQTCSRDFYSGSIITVKIAAVHSQEGKTPFEKWCNPRTTGQTWQSFVMLSNFENQGNTAYCYTRLKVIGLEGTLDLIEVPTRPLCNSYARSSLIMCGYDLACPGPSPGPPQLPSHEALFNV